MDRRLPEDRGRAPSSLSPMGSLSRQQHLSGSYPGVAGRREKDSVTARRRRRHREMLSGVARRALGQTPRWQSCSSHSRKSPCARDHPEYASRFLRSGRRPSRRPCCNRRDAPAKPHFLDRDFTCIAGRLGKRKCPWTVCSGSRSARFHSEKWLAHFLYGSHETRRRAEAPLQATRRGTFRQTGIDLRSGRNASPAIAGKVCLTCSYGYCKNQHLRDLPLLARIDIHLIVFFTQARRSFDMTSSVKPKAKKDRRWVLGWFVWMPKERNRQCAHVVGNEQTVNKGC